ncbi:methyltransferase [Pseudomonas sp.]|uniref:methyltransferase n=1 Tax=Pseudomonas sp. TaxID=306 RepID=UPI00272C0628|nr:methyltransferase [Pseudomonas sp.]
MQTCDTPFGTLSVERYPPTRNPTLQAFDAADLYLIQESAEHLEGAAPVLVVNDQFGALAIAMAKAGRAVLSWGDSDMARRALEANLQRNGLPGRSIAFVDSQTTPHPAPGLVLMRVPKSLSLFEDQLSRLTTSIPNGCPVICGSMLKHLPPTAGNLLERLIGPYQASLAWKKARLLRSSFSQEPQVRYTPHATAYSLPDRAAELHNLPGVFARERLDIGTRVLLPEIPKDLQNALIVDLGCGNGALGIEAALRNPQARVHFVDESFAAIASARLNFERSFPGREASYSVADGLVDGLPEPADLILCNPPFHQQQVVGDEIAVRLFQQAHAALKQGGRLIIVGNRHLGYHLRLRKLFGSVQQLAATPKFVVLAAQRR